MKFLIVFVQKHEHFRLDELHALSQLEGVECRYNPADYSDDCPFLLVEIQSAEAASRLTPSHPRESHL